MTPPPEAVQDALVFAPVGRDATLTRDLLEEAGIRTRICRSVDEVCARLEEGASCLILTEEVFDLPEVRRISEVLADQPPWSDTAVIVFAGSEGVTASVRTVELIEAFPNVTLIDRPVRIAVVRSIVRSAIRARARQTEVRDLLIALRAERERVEEASRLKDEFLATLSHELRTPLNAILGWTSMLRHGGLETGTASRGLEVIERNARAQAQLVEEVLDMARIITGKLRVDLKPVEVTPIVDAAVEAARPAAVAKGIRLEVELGDPRSHVLADAARLHQILWNLLSNAIKFTPEGGTVHLRTGLRDSHVELTVSDSGIGLDPAFLPHVFDRFRQADQSVTRGHGGLGLGLSIVKHLVESHGGQVTVTSPGLGRGTTFTVTLPVPPLAAPPSPHAADDGDAFNLRFPGRRLLIVDDDAATRELLSELFARAGAQVMTASSAADAYALLVRTVPDVMVADIGMPGEDGCSLMRRVRRMPGRAGEVPSIALSAYTRSEDRAAAREAGFSDFLGKPAAPETLLHAVRRLLD